MPLTFESHKKKVAAGALALAIAAPAEGVRQWAYYDPPGILTVCYGHTGGVIKGKEYSLSECRALLSDDMSNAIDIVDRCHPNLPETVLAAFGDTVFNMGATPACDLHESHAARYLKAGDLKAACNELTKWDKARVAGFMVSLPGLTKRRAAERELCMRGI